MNTQNEIRQAAASAGSSIQERDSKRHYSSVLTSGKKRSGFLRPGTRNWPPGSHRFRHDLLRKSLEGRLGRLAVELDPQFIQHLAGQAGEIAAILRGDKHAASSGVHRHPKFIPKARKVSDSGGSVFLRTPMPESLAKIKRTSKRVSCRREMGSRTHILNFQLPANIL